MPSFEKDCFSTQYSYVYKSTRMVRDWCFNYNFILLFFYSQLIEKCEKIFSHFKIYLQKSRYQKTRISFSPQTYFSLIKMVSFKKVIRIENNVNCRDFPEWKLQ